MADDRHAEGLGAAQDLPSDAAQAHDPEGLPLELDAEELAALPPARFDGGVGLRDVAGQGQHQRHGVFRRGERVRGRGVDHRDAAPGGRGKVDVVDAHARASDQTQIGGLADPVGRDLRLRTHQPDARAREGLLEDVGRRGDHVAQVDARMVLEELEALGIDLVGDEDLELGHDQALAPTRRRASASTPASMSGFEI